MSQYMGTYYQTTDPSKGRTCMLTMIYCDKDCTQCVFAGEAYRQAMKEKKGRVKG